MNSRVVKPKGCLKKIKVVASIFHSTGGRSPVTMGVRGEVQIRVVFFLFFFRPCLKLPIRWVI